MIEQLAQLSTQALWLIAILLIITTSMLSIAGWLMPEFRKMLLSIGVLYILPKGAYCVVAATNPALFTAMIKQGWLVFVAILTLGSFLFLYYGYLYYARKPNESFRIAADVASCSAVGGVLAFGFLPLIGMNPLWSLPVATMIPLVLAFTILGVVLWKTNEPLMSLGVVTLGAGHAACVSFWFNWALYLGLLGSPSLMEIEIALIIILLLNFLGTGLIMVRAMREV